MRLLAISLAALTLSIAPPVHAQAAPPSASGDARLEANKAVVRALYDRVLNHHDVDAADRLMRADYIQHNPAMPGGRAAFKATFREVFAAVPDAHVEIVHMVAEGDLVVVHVINSGTPAGTSTPVRSGGFDLFRIQDGLIAEHWDASLPTPPAAAASPAPAHPSSTPPPARPARPEHPLIVPPHPDSTAHP
jgi:predicted SnoaL-like aldol condensation-catalyzing enzyme